MHARVLDLINVKLPLNDEECLFSLTIKDGVWFQIEKQDNFISVQDAVSIDDLYERGGRHKTVSLEGKVLLPGMVDAHMHLDKSFCLPQVGNESGTLEEAVRNYSNAVMNFSKEEIKARFMRAALQSASYGTTAIRTHLDFHVRWGRDVAMRTIEAALEAKQELSPYLDLQLFPLAPYMKFTAAEVEILEEAIRMGMTGVGSAPHLSLTPEADIDKLFALADKYDTLLDFHTDESDDPDVRTLAYIAKRTIEQEWEGRVTVDHLCALASMSDRDAEGLIEQMIAAKLTAVTLPGANLYLQGRHDHFPVRRGVTRIKQLLASGIPLATASDNIHDPFHPFGRGDLLQIGLITAYAAHMGSPADIRTVLRMVTEIPASILGIKDYGVREGNPADFVVFDGCTPEELFTMVPERRWVYRNAGWLKLASPKTGFHVPELNTWWNTSISKLAFAQGGQVLI